MTAQADAKLAQVEATAEARLAEVAAQLQGGLEEACHSTHVALEKRVGEAAGEPPGSHSLPAWALTTVCISLLGCPPGRPTSVTSCCFCLHCCQVGRVHTSCLQGRMNSAVASECPQSTP